MGYTDFSYRHVSLDDLLDAGLQITDTRPGPEEELLRADEKEQVLAVLKVLTDKQARVFKRLADGRTREEIAKRMGVGIQAVYQISFRIKQKLAKAKKIKLLTQRGKQILRNRKDLSRSAVYLFFLANPEIKADRLLDSWNLHPVLKCYYKPTLFELREWLADYYNE